MKVLIYVREWNKNFYIELVKKAFDNPQIETISDFNNLGNIWSGEYIYNTQYDYSNEAYEKEKDDIIRRCRFLRSIPYQKAEELSQRFWNGIEKRFEEQKYQVVVSALIDCYTMDIIERIAKKNNCQFLSLVTFFAKGYSRFTRRGELFPAKREVSDEEVEKVLNMLTDDMYKVNYSLNSEKNESAVIKYYYRRKLIENIYFPYKKRAEKDVWNYHYNTISFREGAYRKYSIKTAEKCFEKLSELKLEKKDVYMPLHYSPEATVDYWADDPKYALYEESVVNLIQESDKEVRFIIKEHPAMYGKRSLSFYNNLMKCKNVVLVHPYENSNVLMKEIHNVLVYTGSVGVEALLRGKNVLTVTDNYYSDTSINIKKISKVTKDLLVDYDLENDNYTMMKKILSGIFIANSTAGRDIEKSDIDNIALEMRRIYESTKS